jgi:hypothetical protein
MSQRHKSQGDLDGIREELRHQFDRAAIAEGPSTRWLSKRARMMLAAGLVVVAIPSAAAAGGAFDGDDATISVNGDAVSINGQPIDCPADESLKASLGLDPCRILTEPAPAPLSEQPAARSSFEGEDPTP